MVDLGRYKIEDLNSRKITPQESFTDVYVYEVHKSEQILTSTKILHKMLDTKYENAYLNKVTNNQCQYLT